MEAWLGVLHLVRKDEEAQEDFEGIAAVFCVDRQGFETVAKSYSEAQGYQLLWVEEVHPAGQWVARHPKERKAAGLARAVHEHHTVELGILRAVGKEGEELPEPEYLTITEHEIMPLPDQDGIPFWDKEWIAPELKELLFGQPERGSRLRTYFIVDATLRKNITGVFDLDSSSIDIPVKCLFKGEKAEELKEVAPHLIDMTLPDGAWDNKDLVPSFHKDFFKKHWGKNTGSFIRTPALMADVWGHFRKFPRIQIEENKSWVYFSFWDCRLAPSYFKSINHIPEKVAQWVDSRGEPLVHSFLGEVEHSSSIWVATPDRKKLEGFASVGTPMLSNIELEGFRLNQIDRYANDLVRHFREKDPLHAEAVGDKALKQIIMTGIERAKTYGLTRKDPVRLYIQLMLGLGVSFDKDPMLPWANEVLRSGDHEDGQAGKSNLLRGYLLSYLKETNGEGGKHLKTFSDHMQKKLSDLKEDESIKSTFEFLIAAHPYKARYLGSEMLNRLIENTDQLCKKYGLHKGRSLFILACMRFTYGAGVVDDPQYLWRGNAVKNDPKEGSKDDALHQVSLKFAEKVDEYVKEMA